MFIPEPTSNYNLAVLFFLQLTILLVSCRVVGRLARLLGQPQVVSEMITGVLLGPSFFGAVAPQVHAAIFPKESLKIIYVLAQLGLVLYMFLVGTEFDHRLIRARVRSALSVSVAGMVVPFGLGALLAWSWHGDHGLFTEGVRTWEAMLYLGAAMCITAFPMLARIISERRMSGTALGTLALAAGSSDDAAAWCLLAVVLASFGGTASIAMIAIGGGVAYALFCLLVGRRLLRPLGAGVERAGTISAPRLGFILALLMLAAWFTDAIRIYAVFGAFILGVSMPRGVLTARLRETLEPATTNLLLPMFFVYSGLNTRLDLVNSPHLWMLALIVLAAACVGKGVACAAAAKLNGETMRDSLAIGALMNARGLMELIILNIGLEKGLITPQLFSIMVVMAVVTTLMATPLFEWVYRGERGAAGATG